MLREEWGVKKTGLKFFHYPKYRGGDAVQGRLEKLFGKRCDADDLLVLDKFLLRKQIMKKARETALV